MAGRSASPHRRRALGRAVESTGIASLWSPAVRKLVTNAFGSLDDLVVVEQPDLEPGPGQVVVEVEAAGVNFVDALIVQGRYQFTPPLPHTPGTEVAGVIAAIGEGVTTHVPGQRVVALPLERRVRIAGRRAGDGGRADPRQPDVRAGRRRSCRATRPRCTRSRAARPCDLSEWFVVLGAGGGVGLAATDMATALGGQVVACASTEEKLALATAAGAVATIAYEEVDLKDAIREITDGGADLVLDPDRRSEGRVGAAGAALGGALPRRRLRLRRHPPLPAQPGPAQQPHADRDRARRLGAPRAGRLPRPHRRADRPRRRWDPAPRRAGRPAARRRPRPCSPTCRPAAISGKAVLVP